MPSAYKSEVPTSAGYVGAIFAIRTINLDWLCEHKTVVIQADKRGVLCYWPH